MSLASLVYLWYINTNPLVDIMELAIKPDDRSNNAACPSYTYVSGVLMDVEWTFVAISMVSE